MVGNLIHPVTPINDPAGVARVIADAGAWAAMHYAIVLGIVLMLGGLVPITTRSEAVSPAPSRGSGWWLRSPAPRSA